MPNGISDIPRIPTDAELAKQTQQDTDKLLMFCTENFETPAHALLACTILTASLAKFGRLSSEQICEGVRLAYEGTEITGDTDETA